MSVIENRYVIFNCLRKEPLDGLREFIVRRTWALAKDWDAEGYFSWEKMRNYLQPVIKTIMNEEYFLFLAPDGGKEGGEVSNIFDEVFEDVVAYVDKWNFKDESRDPAEQIRYFSVYEDNYQDRRLTPDRYRPSVRDIFGI